MLSIVFIFLKILSHLHYIKKVVWYQKHVSVSVFLANCSMSKSIYLVFPLRDNVTKVRVSCGETGRVHICPRTKIPQAHSQPLIALASLTSPYIPV